MLPLVCCNELNGAGTEGGVGKKNISFKAGSGLVPVLLLVLIKGSWVGLKERTAEPFFSMRSETFRLVFR